MTKQEFAERGTRAEKEILSDMQKGIVSINCDSFSELHDYVDANYYGGLYDDDYKLSKDFKAENFLQTVLSRWLKKANFEIQTIESDGLHYQLWKYGKNDYSMWITDDLEDSSSGCSVRGSFNQVTEDCNELFSHLICL